MKYKNIIEGSDSFGSYKTFSQKNGVKITLRKKMSKSYKDKLEKLYVEIEENKLKKEKLEFIKNKIKKKQEELAVQELLKTGEITQEELDKIEGK